MNRRSVGIVCFGLLVALALAGCGSRPAPPIDRGDTPTATSTLGQTQEASDPAQIFYRSQAYHLKVALPPGWASAEGPTYLARPFTGLVAFNSWGEPGFWVPELRTATGATYGPDSVMKQIPSQGAYVVLVHFSGGPPMPAEQYGPEYEQQDLGGVWDQADCRQGGIRAGITWSDFFKWGRRLRLEVYCDSNASDATAKAVNALLASWRFDRVPVGDVGWAIVQARPLLPAAVEPARFPLALGQAGGVSQTMAQDGVVARITQAEVQGETVVITFKYRWNEPQLGAGSGSDDCPPHRCHWWRFEARPSGEVVPVEQGGADLDPDAGGESSKPEPSEQAQRIPSPDGQWIAVLDKTAGSLDLHSADGATWAVFPPGSTVSTAGWSPDSQQLLVVRTNWILPQPGVEAQTIGPIEIWRIRVDDQAGEPELVFQSSDWPNASGGLAPEAIELGPWSPDNRHVLFWHSPLSASALADGATLRVLDTQTNQVTPLGKALLSQRYHSWAPDSSALAITLGGYRSAQVNKWLSLFDVKSGQVTTLVSKTEQIPGLVAWSPRGDLIAYAAVPAEETGEDLADWMVFDNPAIAGRRVYLLDPGSGEHWRLNDAAAFQDAPTWSDDGAVLYYVQREGDTMTLMAADPATGQAQGVQGAQLPAPEAVGYYGRAEWEDLLAYRLVATPLAHSVPFTVCQSSETWTRPNETEQAAQVWDAPRRQGTPREMLWWTFQQSFYRYGGGGSEMFDAWPEHGLWTAVDDAYTCGGTRIEDIVTGRKVELWVLLHRVIAAERQGDVYTLTVEPFPSGYQIVHLPGPGPVTPIEVRSALVPASVRFVDADGREIDCLPKFPPWADPDVPTTRDVVTATGVVVDNALSARVVTLQETDGTTWYLPWMETTVVRRADGARAQFQDIARGMVLDVAGFRRVKAASFNTLSAVRVSILENPL